MAAGDNYELEEMQLKQDDPTAKKKCIRILKEMEFRCMNATIMNYELSNYYDDLDTGVSFVSSIAAGMAAIPAAKIIPAAKALGHSGNTATKFGLGIIIGAATSAVAYTKAAEVLLPNLRRKTEKYNMAGAAWQRLELNIRGFLASSTMDQTTVNEYRQFIEHCADKREEICNIARPEQWSYKKYNATCQHVLQKYKEKKQWHAEFRKQQKEVEESLQKS